MSAMNLINDEIKKSQDEITRLKYALIQERDAKNAAYLERNQCVALIARMAIKLGNKAGRAITAIEGWEPEWHNCVYIDLPSGQVSWHYHDKEKALFESLPEYKSAWDGHSTDEKYNRVNLAYLGDEVEELEQVKAERDYYKRVMESNLAATTSFLTDSTLTPSELSGMLEFPRL